MRRRSLRFAAAVAAAVPILLMAGCGSSDDPQPAPTVTADGLTAPGTVLHLGDTATVPSWGGDAVLDLTVTSIDRGTAAELRSTGRLEHPDQWTPYYVHYTIRSVSGDPYGMTMQNYLTAWSGSTMAGQVTPSKPFAPCQEKNFPVGSGSGTSLDSCRIYLAAKGDPAIDRVRFNNDADYDTVEQAVTWRQ